MTPSLERRLEALWERHEELARLMADPEVVTDAERFASLSREYAELEPVARGWERYADARRRLQEAERLAHDEDAELAAIASEEAEAARAELARLEAELQGHLVPRDPDDARDVYLEIRAGTGGDEAALFAGDLLRMYQRYAERQGWRLELVSERAGELGGFREVVVRIGGRDVYRRLKFESGTHRVQRVPATESQGRIHTSACTVAVLPEPDEQAAVELDRNELRVDTYRASGAGGQHVNKTDSAVRVTHLPTGIVVECQDERSQHKNRARALSLLRARLEDIARREQEAQQAASRRSMVGSGDRSERIRTYNFPQGRITDHRIQLTLYRLQEALDGDLEPLIDPLLREHDAEQLAALGA